MNFENFKPGVSSPEDGEQENSPEVEPKKKDNRSKFMRTVQAGLAGAMLLGAAGCEKEQTGETRPVDEVKQSGTNQWTTSDPSSFLKTYLKHKLGWGGRMQVNEAYEQQFKQSLDSYFATVNAGKTPTRRESEARAENFARKAGYSNRQLSIRCKNGVPVEIKILDKTLSLQPGEYSAAELSAINQAK